MQRYRTIAPYLLPCVCVAAILCVAAQNKESGDDPYTPTKLEWLVVEANAKHRESRPDYDIFFIPSTPDTLYIHAMVGPECDRTVVERRIAFCRHMIEEYATRRRWKWLIIREMILDKD